MCTQLIRSSVQVFDATWVPTWVHLEVWAWEDLKRLPEGKDVQRLWSGWEQSYVMFSVCCRQLVWCISQEAVFEWCPVLILSTALCQQRQSCWTTLEGHVWSWCFGQRSGNRTVVSGLSWLSSKTSGSTNAFVCVVFLTRAMVLVAQLRSWEMCSSQLQYVQKCTIGGALDSLSYICMLTHHWCCIYKYFFPKNIVNTASWIFQCCLDCL